MIWGSTFNIVSFLHVTRLEKLNMNNASQNQQLIFIYWYGPDSYLKYKLCKIRLDNQ